MVVLRGTAKVLRYLSDPVVAPAESETALGDWYVNRISVGRQPLLLLASSKSLLVAIEAARDVRGVPGRLQAIVADRLRRLGVREELVLAEVGAMDPVVVAKTDSRSVLGFMNDFAHSIPYYLGRHGARDEGLRRVEEQLWDTPCWASRRLSEGFFPDKRTHELLEEKWAGGGSLGTVR